MIRPNFPSVAVMRVIWASFALAARSGSEMLEGRGEGRDSESSAMRALRMAQEMPRGLKEGREKRRRSSLMRRLLMLRVLAMVGRGMRVVSEYEGRVEWKAVISVLDEALPSNVV